MIQLTTQHQNNKPICQKVRSNISLSNIFLSSLELFVLEINNKYNNNNNNKSSHNVNHVYKELIEQNVMIGSQGQGLAGCVFDVFK